MICRYLLTTLVAAVLLSSVVTAQQQSLPVSLQSGASTQEKSTTQEESTEDKEPKRQKMSFIKVQGNKFIDENEKPIAFKGMAISDPDKVANDGHWNRKHFETIKSWGANLIRIPVHPSRYRSRGKESYLKLLDQAVQWCGELEIYIIVDWHSIGNLRAKKFEADQYKTSLLETQKFWQTVSKRYAGNPTLAFYEIFNEPTLNFGEFGKCTWQQWKTMVEKTIDTIYANNKNAIPLVAGFDWAYDLREVKKNPIDRPGVAYVAHPYPGKCKPPREPHWEKHFGFLANRHPIIATEMGYYLKGDYEYMIDDQKGTYRNALLKYLDKKKISWCTWVFDPDWEPALIKSYNYEPTHAGKFFRNAMLEGVSKSSN